MLQRSHTPKGQLARTRILRAAEPLLAGHGFYGTSMRDVAEASGLPLASVVYHFARKESLHAAVLEDIASELLAALEEAARGAGPGDVAEASARALVQWSLRHPGRVRLILRELLDNPARVSQARSLPLAPVLRALVRGLGVEGRPAPELAVLHVIGAVSYVVAARPTLRRIVGAERDRELMAAYEEHAVSFARQVLTGAATEPRQDLAKDEERHAAAATDRARPTDPAAPRGEDDGLGPVRRPPRHARVRG